MFLPCHIAFNFDINRCVPWSSTVPKHGWRNSTGVQAPATMKFKWSVWLNSKWPKTPQTLKSRSTCWDFAERTILRTTRIEHILCSMSWPSSRTNMWTYVKMSPIFEPSIDSPTVVEIQEKIHRANHRGRLKELYNSSLPESEKSSLNFCYTLQSVIREIPAEEIMGNIKCSALDCISAKEKEFLTLCCIQVPALWGRNFHQILAVNMLEGSEGQGIPVRIGTS